MGMRALLLSAAIGFAAITASAHADPIAAGSMISFADGASYNNTTITFNSPVNIPIASASGSFATAFGSGCTGCAAFTTFNFANFSSPTTVYTATLNGATTSLSLQSLTYSVSPTFLNIQGTGQLSLTGYTPTQGTFFLSSQGGQNVNVSFSATSIASATAVPEPVSMAILGVGLAGLGLVRRRK